MDFINLEVGYHIGSLLAIVLAVLSNLASLMHGENDTTTN
jgi:hypothetical protein